MIKRGLEAADLAKALGRKRGTIYNVILGTPSRKLRIKIEDFLGVAIWSTPEKFASRQTARQAPAGPAANAPTDNLLTHAHPIERRTLEKL
jgi:hypothetical protein